MVGPARTTVGDDRRLGLELSPAPLAAATDRSPVGPGSCSPAAAAQPAFVTLVLSLGLTPLTSDVVVVDLVPLLDERSVGPGTSGRRALITEQVARRPGVWR